MMTLLNEIYYAGSITRDELRTFLLILNPFAPHVTEEINELLSLGSMLAVSEWPTYDESKCADDTVEIAVQVNGKLRGRISIPADISEEDAISLAKKEEKVAAEIEGRNIIKELYVKGRLVNIVAK